MSKNTLFLAQLSLCVILLYWIMGCGQQFYAPNTAHVPMLAEKGDASISGAVSVGNQTEGFDLHAAYSPMNHVGVMVNMFHTNATGKYDKRGGWLAEGGIGGYKLIGKFWYASVYGVIGGGKVNNLIVYDTLGNFVEKTGIGFGRAFVQPAFGFRSPYFEAAITARLIGLNYGEFTPPQTQNSNYDFSYYQTISRQGYIGIEPSLVLRAGVKKIKAYTSLTVSYLDIPVPYGSPNFNLGLQVPLHIGK